MNPIALIIPIALLALLRRGGSGGAASGGVADPNVLRQQAQEARLHGNTAQAATLQAQADAANAIVSVDGVLT